MIAGRITSSETGEPIQSVRTEVLVRQIGSDAGSVLSVTETDAEGRFLFDLGERVIRENEVLIVRALGEANVELARSGPIFDATDDPFVDLAVDEASLRKARSGPAISEFRQHSDAVRRLIGDKRIEDLGDEDLDILSGKTGVARDHLGFLRAAEAHSSTAVGWGLWNEDDRNAPILYGLMRQGVPTELRGIADAGRRAWLTALGTALDQNLIPAGLRAELDGAAEQLVALAVKLAFDGKDTDPKSPPVGVVVRTATDVDEDLQEDFVRRHVEFEGGLTEETFWSELESVPEFAADPKSVSALRFTVEAAALLEGNTDALRRVQARRVQEGWTSVRDLAALTRGEWRDMASGSVATRSRDVEDRYAESVAHAD